MRPGVSIWIMGTLIGVTTAPLVPAIQAEAQDFKVPLSVSHFVYNPGENIAELEQLQRWTIGLGLMVGAREPYSERQRGIYGLVA